MADSNKAKLVLDSANGVAVVTLLGDWTVAHLPEEERVALGCIPKNYHKLIINGASLEEVDTSGAWLILKAIRSLQFGGEIVWVGFAESQQKIIHMIAGIKHDALPGYRSNFYANSVIELGKYCIGGVDGTMKLTNFFGQLCVAIISVCLHPSRLRFKSIVYHINEIGIQALPIVALMALFISLVLGYQGANELRQFGAKEFTVNLVAISHLREMGVLITAIMLAGRSCSAFAAHIGVMQMNDEISAMRTLGLDPFELLVLPRIIATILVLPVLTIVADMAGILGDYFVASAYLELSRAQFIQRLLQSVNEMTFYIGMMKAPVFGYFIALIGCYQGFQVRTSATELGLRTTAAVVQAIFWVVLGDAIFSIIFTWLGI